MDSSHQTISNAVDSDSSSQSSTSSQQQENIHDIENRNDRSSKKTQNKKTSNNKSHFYLTGREAHELQRLLEKICATGVVKLPKSERPKVTRSQKRRSQSSKTINDDDDDDGDDGDDDEEENDDDEEEEEESDQDADSEFDDNDDISLPSEEESNIMNDNTISEAAREQKLLELRLKVIRSKKQQNDINASAARCIIKSLNEEGYLVPISDSDEESDDRHEVDEEENDQNSQQQQQQKLKSESDEFFAASRRDNNNESASHFSTTGRKKSVKLIPEPPQSQEASEEQNSKSFYRKKALQESVISKMKASINSSSSKKQKNDSSANNNNNNNKLMEMSGVEMVHESSSASMSFNNNNNNNNSGSLNSSLKLNNRKSSSTSQNQHHQLNRDKSTIRSLFAHTRTGSSSSMKSSVGTGQMQVQHQQQQSRRKSSSGINHQKKKSLLLGGVSGESGSTHQAARSTTDTVTAILSALAGVFACRFVCLLVPDELKLRELRCVAYAGADAASKSMDSFSSSSYGSNTLLVAAASLALHHNTVVNVRYPRDENDDDDNDSDIEGSDVMQLALKREKAKLQQLQQSQQQSMTTTTSTGTKRKTSPVSSSNTASATNGSALSHGAVSTALSVPVPGPNNYAVGVLHVMDRSYGVENFSQEDESVAWCYAKLISRIIGAFESRRKVAPDRQIQRALATVLKSVENVDGTKIRKLLDGDFSQVQNNNSNNYSSSSENRGSNSNRRVDRAWDDTAGTRAPPVFRTYSHRVQIMLQKLKQNQVLFTTKASEARGSIVDCEYHINLDHFSSRMGCNNDKKRRSSTNNNNQNDQTEQLQQRQQQGCGGCESLSSASSMLQPLHPTVDIDDLLPLCVLTDHVHRVADAWYRTAALLAESRSEVSNLQTDVKRLTQEVNTMRLKMDVQRQLLSNNHYTSHNTSNSNNNNSSMGTTNSSKRHLQNVSPSSLVEDTTNPSSLNNLVSHQSSATPSSNHNNHSSPTMTQHKSYGVGGIIIQRDPLTGEVAITKQSQLSYHSNNTGTGGTSSHHVPSMNTLVFSPAPSSSSATTSTLLNTHQQRQPTSTSSFAAPPKTPQRATEGNGRKKSVTISGI